MEGGWPVVVVLVATAVVVVVVRVVVVMRVVGEGGSYRTGTEIADRALASLSVRGRNIAGSVRPELVK